MVDSGEADTLRPPNKALQPTPPPPAPIETGKASGGEHTWLEAFFGGRRRS